ncbi:GumC family protein [Ostreiculturibacter nitratireducens]|uniref:GumC family protein n=1 Tax=Ostreiculturibacter nitratireducens TaxID=3075226 RepID=UPI0031B58978
MNKENERFLEKELLSQNLGADAGEAELHLVRDLSLALKRGIFWIILAAMLGGIGGLLLSSMMERKYTSIAQVMIDTRAPVATDFAPVVSGLPTSTTTLESELEVLRSLDLIEHIVDRFDLSNDPEFFSANSEPTDEDLSEEQQALVRREMTIEAVAKKRSIEQIGTISAVYAISFTTNDPKKSADLANALAQEYLKTTTAAKLRSLELSQGWLTERTSEMQESLSDLSVKLERHILAAPFSPEEVNTIKAKSLTVERRLRDRNEALPVMETKLGRAQVLRSIDRFDLAAREIAVPGSALALALQAYEVGSADAASRLESALDDTINSMQADRIKIRQEIIALEDELESMREILTEQARHDAETSRIENDITVAEAIYQDFVSQLSRRTQQERYLDADARVISAARPALDPSEPKRKVMAIQSAVLVMIAAVLVLVLRELRQNHLRTVREYEEATGLPLIGVIPQAEEVEIPTSALTTGPNAFSPRMMRFARKLAASVDAHPQMPSTQHRADTKRKSAKRATVIAGVAANPGEGLTLSMQMLAAAYAEAGENVLLVDLDFWNSPYSTGSSRAKSDATGLLDPTARAGSIVKTGWDTLSVLPATNCADNEGAPITAEAFEGALSELSKTFDLILVDTAPLMHRIDAASLCRVADLSLLFVRWDTTTREAVTSTLKLLSDVGVTPSAVIATRVDTARISGFGERALYFPAAAKSAAD